MLEMCQPGIFSEVFTMSVVLFAEIIVTCINMSVYDYMQSVYLFDGLWQIAEYAVSNRRAQCELADECATEQVAAYNTQYSFTRYTATIPCVLNVWKLGYECQVIAVI